VSAAPTPVETTPVDPPSLAEPLRDAIRPTLEDLLDMAVQLWWLLAIVGAILLIRLLLFVRRQRRLARSGIREIDTMDGASFENYLATMFRRLGYRVRIVGSVRGDYGGDLLIQKNGSRTIVQAKRYRGKRVGIKAVQEAHTARTMYECADAMVVTNSTFSPQAVKTARKTGVRLWDREELVKHLLEAEDAPEPATPVPATPPAPPTVTAAPKPVATDARCAECGVPVSAKVHAFCIDNAERFGGLVYCFKHQRGFRSSPSATS
jgi:restriction system protein